MRPHKTRRGAGALKYWKRQPPRRGDDDLEFPWEGDAFFEEDTSEYFEVNTSEHPEVRGSGRGGGEGVAAASLDDPASAEDIDQVFEETDPEVEQTSEVLDQEESDAATASMESSYTSELSPGQRFFPDVPELARDEEGSAESGPLRTTDEISRIIALNRPRPGPFLRWYFSLAPRRRRRVYRGLWMLGASTMIITLFSFATVVIFPLMEARFTATFGPRPEDPVRLLPEAGVSFALVEDRPYPHDRFVAGMDCIWVTRDPVESSEIAGFGPFLERDGEVIALLDVEETWNGMARLYFERGEIPLDEPVDLVIPVEGGGTVPLERGPGYRLATEGGPASARVVLGPIFFSDDFVQ